MKLHSPLGTDLSPFISADSRPHGGCSHTILFQTILLNEYISIFSPILSFFSYNRRRKTRMLLLQGIHQFLFLSFSPEVTILSTAINWCLKKDWFLFIWPPTHGWIGHRPISLPFPFSSYWFNGHDFNKAPFPSALQRQPTWNNFKFDISLRFNFVAKENNIKVTQMNIILSCSLGGFWSCFTRIVQLRRVNLMLC